MTTPETASHERPPERKPHSKRIPKDVRSKSTFEYEDVKFSVSTSLDPDFDPVDDMRDVVRVYQSYLKKSREPRSRMSSFDRELLRKKRFRKGELKKYLDDILLLTAGFQSRLADFIPREQGHLLSRAPKSGYSLEMMVHRQYSKNDYVETKSRKELTHKDFKEWTPEEILYIDNAHSRDGNIIVLVDASHLFRKIARPAFLRKGRLSEESLRDFMQDMAHEIVHFPIRFSPHMERVYDFEDAFDDAMTAAPEKQTRDFFIKDMLMLITEEGIANFSVYGEDRFWYEPKIPLAFRRKVNSLIYNKKPERYFSKQVYVESYEKQGPAGIYYMGEAACYFIALGLERKIGTKIITLEKDNPEYLPGSRKKAEREAPPFVEIHSNNLAQELSSGTTPIYFSTKYDEFLVAFEHIINMSHETFFAEFYSAQEALGIPDQYKLFSKPEVEKWIAAAKNVPVIRQDAASRKVMAVEPPAMISLYSVHDKL